MYAEPITMALTVEPEEAEARAREVCTGARARARTSRGLSGAWNPGQEPGLSVAYPAL